jgi:two-component system chemotaxis sensor kinase CheA
MTGDTQATAGGLDHFRKTYFEECAELLDAAYAHLADLGEQRGDAETLHAIFRAVHSIKGGGGAFGFGRLVAFAHQLETLLDRLRDGRVAATVDIAALLVRATDALSDLVEAARSGDPAGGVEREDALCQALREAADGAPSPAPAELGPPATAVPTLATGGATAAARYRIRFVPRAEMFQRANEPLLLVRELKRLGEVRVDADIGRLPDLAALEPEHAYLSWTIEIVTRASRADIEEVFEFVVDDCELGIDVIACAPAGPAVPAAVDVAAAPTLPPAAEVATPAAGRATVAGAQPSIRVDVDKVDRVVNLVGELVINQAMLMQLSSGLPPDLCSGLSNGLETLSQQLRELQESVMAIRAQPVKSVFARMPRLVREVAAQLGKDVRLVVTGEATEIDKTVIEQLADPLTHLLRNALDHGIEPPDERESLGKPRQGTVHLSAEHRSGRIVIAVADDGRGIDRARVLAKAKARGIVAPGQVLGDEEIDDLIFLPSFSTAEAVSSISGRGVGMDVVKRNMQALGGRIAVQSRLGAGSLFTLSLPLTLAVLDGMVVAVGAETYIIPLTNIVESLRPAAADIHRMLGRGDVLAIRGDYVPLVHLHRRFAVPGAVTDPCQGIVVIVDGEGEGRVGLVADELVGQQQVVVKSLEANFGPVDGISAATILGTGRVALILDVSRLQDGRRALGSRFEKRPVAAGTH